ncbi:MAG: matrixin family metalloprotease [Deltaproteobacteria bacterium]|nr:matrixin family metalloprotease [Deltaproteobacteria bacterium]
MRRALVILIALAAPWTAHAYDLEQASDGAPVRWASGFTLYVDASSRNVSASDVMAAATAAGAQWSKAAAVDVEVQSEPQHGEPGYDPEHAEGNRSEVIFVESDWEYDMDVAATTLVTTDTVTHQIVDADILVNEDQNRFDVLPANSKPGYGLELDLQGCLTHELGHALGLAHSAGHAEATMFAGTEVGEISKRELAPDDVDGVQFLYGTPGSPKTPCAAGCTAGLGPDGVASLLAALSALASARRRRRARMLACGLVFAGLTLAVAATAWADEGSRSPRPAENVEKVLAGQVTHTVSRWQGGRIYTDVEVEVATCSSGSCDSVETYRVPGGTVGRLQQQLGDVHVPAPGEDVQVSLARARDGHLRPLVAASHR